MDNSIVQLLIYTGTANHLVTWRQARETSNDLGHSRLTAPFHCSSFWSFFAPRSGILSSMSYESGVMGKPICHSMYPFEFLLLSFRTVTIYSLI
jgi:hypothetical protein